MNSGWPENRDIQSIDDFSDWLASAGLHPERVYRGQADSEWNLEPSLDRNVQEPECFEDRVQKEKEYIEIFCNRARKFLSEPERCYLADPNHRVLRMTLMQHYGAPTRLLDWTKTRAIAAYFACIRHEDVEGTIWWINSVEVADWLTGEWPRLGYERRPHADSEINLNDRLDDPAVLPFVSMTHLPDPFDRVAAQDGLFTFGSRPGMLHDDQLMKQLREGSYGRVIIPANLKIEVIESLERKKINAKSLGYAGADQVGLRMTWDREHGK